MAQVAIMPSPLPFADPLLLSDSLGLLHPLSFLGQTLLLLADGALAHQRFERQIAEVQVRVAVLNGFTALGIPVTQVVA